MSFPGAIAPILPDKPLFWNGIPLFHVGTFPPDFSGRLYFVLGQGLGDHVNGFRILHEVMWRFPKATCVVYADLRWEELVLRIDRIERRWYAKASDVLSQDGTNNPYDRAHSEVRREIKACPGSAFLAYAHFPMPDRHARQETTLEATARAIGLSLGDRARPYLPLLPDDVRWAESFLVKHGLERGRFAVVSPFSWANKIWGKENFSQLIDQIRDRFGLRSIVASYPIVGDFLNEGVVKAYDLTLGQLAGLFSLAGLYIGLDSGPSHMAAFFDRPMVVIFVEKRTIPFEVRPLSPLSLNIVESFFEDCPVPRVQTVLDGVSSLLQSDPGHPFGLPLCPACRRSMHYLVTSCDTLLRLMCSCGLMLDDLPGGQVEDAKMTGFAQEQCVADSLDLCQDLGTMKAFYSMEESIEIGSPTTLDFIQGIHQQGPSGKMALESGRLIWSLDPLVIWMNRKNYVMERYSRDSVSKRLSFTRVDPGMRKSPTKVALDWGGARVHVSAENYLRWYSYERWGNPKSFVGIVKAQVELGFDRMDVLLCAWTAFSSDSTLRSFRWLIKGLFFKTLRF